MATEDSSSTISQAKTKMQDLINAQDKVDKGIDAMPEGPEKTRLKKLRDDNRGFFSSTILPAWKKLQTLLNEETDPPKPGESTWYNPTTWFSGDDTMGLIPLIPVAAVLAATAFVGYVGNSIVVENRILSDPSFTAAQKTSLLQSSGLSSLTNAFGQAKWVLLLGVIGGGAYIFQDQIKALIPKKSNPRKKRRHG